jgi:hypothetical protein
MRQFVIHPRRLVAGSARRVAAGKHPMRPGARSAKLAEVGNLLMMTDTEKLRRFVVVRSATRSVVS